MSPCRTLEGLSRKMCERLHTSLVVQKMQLGQKTRWHWRGIGPRCAGIPRSLAAADEEELPKMPSTRFPRPLGAAGGRADHQPLRSRQNLLWQDLGRSVEDSRWNLLRLEGLAVRLLSGALPYPQGPEKRRIRPSIDDGAMLNADSFDFGLLARYHLQRLHAR